MNPQQFRLWLGDGNRPPLVMGVLNVTPDSFSDGGRFADPAAAVDRAQEMAAAGASIIDIGGESTRPGSQPVEPEEQIGRVVPVIKKLAGNITALLSIDTSRASVARAALDAGAHLVNDIFGGREDPDLLPLVARAGVPIILMHMQGRPATMQNAPQYGDVVAEIRDFLHERLAAARAVGIDSASVLLDPGIGFGKTLPHNLELLRRLAEFKSLGQPLVVGASRKGFIGKITGEDLASRRLFGTAASVAWSIACGADIVRVHDVSPMSQVVAMVRAIKTGAVPEIK